jgi:hypothetical protein
MAFSAGGAVASAAGGTPIVELGRDASGAATGLLGIARDSAQPDASIHVLASATKPEDITCRMRALAADQMSKSFAARPGGLISSSVHTSLSPWKKYQW